MTTIGNGVVELTARDAQLQEVARRVERTMMGLQNSVQGIGRGMVTLLAGLGIGAGLKTVVDAAAAGQKAMNDLEEAIYSARYSVAEWLPKLSDAADRIKEVTNVDDDLIRTTMAYAITTGTAVGATEDLIKAAIGLSRVTGGDLRESLKQLTLAQAGEFQMLQRSLPALRAAKDDTERLRIVNEIASRGFEQAQRAMGTYEGQLGSFKLAVGDLEKAVGGGLLPTATGVLKAMRPMVTGATDWARGNQALVGTITKLTAATVLTIAVVPQLADHLNNVTSLTKTFGAALVTLATGPVGIVVAGIAAIAAAMAMTMGEGDTMASAFVDGMGKMAQVLDGMLGSIEGFTTGATGLWAIMTTQMAKDWLEFDRTVGNSIDEIKRRIANLQVDGAKSIWGVMSSIGEKVDPGSKTRQTIMGTSINGISVRSLLTGILGENVGNNAANILGSTFSDKDMQRQLDQQRAGNDANAARSTKERNAITTGALDQADAQTKAEIDALLEKLKSLPKASDRIKGIIDNFKAAIAPPSPDTTGIKDKFTALLPGPGFGEDANKVKAPKERTFTPTIEGLEDSFKRIQTAAADDPVRETAANTKDIAGHTKQMADDSKAIREGIDTLNKRQEEILNRPNPGATYA